MVEAHEERGHPEADAVADEGEKREGEARVAKRRRAEDQLEGHGIPSAERLRPRERRVDPEAEGDPLCRVSRRGAEGGGEGGQAERSKEVAYDCRFPRARHGQV